MHTAHSSGTRHVVVVGAGGNIGSHLIPHLARMPEIGRLTLVDRDSYEEANLVSQAITATAIARRKAPVQAAIARGISLGLDVRSIAENVEDVPLGLLRGDLILACLDSRKSRQYVNEAAIQLGVPWIDAGVLADGLLARISAFASAPDAPCLECGWDAGDYAAIEQTYPCAQPHSDPPSTNAPSSLGALAAALQAIECEKVLTGRAGVAFDSVAELVVGTSPHCHYLTAHRRNPRCRLGDHERLAVVPLACDPQSVSLGTLVDALADGASANGSQSLRVPGKWFVRTLTCSSCGIVRPTLRLSSALNRAQPPCSKCAGTMIVAGTGVSERLELVKLTPRDRARTCAAIGIRAGEIIAIEGDSGTRHVEVGRQRVSKLSPNHIDVAQLAFGRRPSHCGANDRRISPPFDGVAEEVA